MNQVDQIHSEVMEKSRYQCVIKNSDCFGGHQIHHIDGENSNDTLDNLIYVCEGHHARIHLSKPFERKFTPELLKKIRDAFYRHISTSPGADLPPIKTSPKKPQDKKTVHLKPNPDLTFETTIWECILVLMGIILPLPLMLVIGPEFIGMDGFPILLLTIGMTLYLFAYRTKRGKLFCEKTNTRFIAAGAVLRLVFNRRKVEIADHLTVTLTGKGGVLVETKECPCPFPGCKGIIRYTSTPYFEKNLVHNVAACTQFKKAHSYEVENDIGRYRRLDWTPKPKK